MNSPGGIHGILAAQAPEVLTHGRPITDGILIHCPFHNERTPSCSVSLVSPVWYCHGCGESGHLSKLLVGLGMPADRARSATEYLGNDSSFLARNKNNHYSLYSGNDPFRGNILLEDTVLNPFMFVPLELEQQGYKERTLQHFEIGFDPDRFRIIFPIRNIYGDLIGLSGRTVIGEEPRYKIYKQELREIAGVSQELLAQGVDKGVTLWHAHKTYPFLFRTKEKVVVVEGFKACMWVWQSGIKNVVALMGSAATKYQCELLARLGSPIVLFLDNDPTGIIKTDVVGKKLWKTNDVMIARYPDSRPQPDRLTEAEIHQCVDLADDFSVWMRNRRQENEYVHG